MRTYDENDLVNVFRFRGIKCELFWDGHPKLMSYIFSFKGKELLRGEDFGFGSSCPDVKETMISLLGFMVVNIGDTDKDYFKNHTPQMLEFLDHPLMEELRVFIWGYEGGKREEHYASSLAWLKRHIKSL